MRLPVLLVMVSQVAVAYELKKDSRGDSVTWAGPVTFIVDQDLDAKLNAPGAIDAVKAAIATWQLAGIQVTVEPGAVDGSADGVMFSASPNVQNKNEIVVIDHDWPYDDSVMAVTIVTVDPGTHTIMDADIAINAAQNKFKVLAPDSKRGGGYADIQNTITHELGHSMGLAHEPAHADAVMYPMAYDGEVNKRVLSSDDLAGLDVLYPADQDMTAVRFGCSAGGSTVPLCALMLVMLGRARSRRPSRVAVRSAQR